ncbi:hypothetical protein H7I77_04400 [Mycolicibacterium novocastrense]|uniref:ComE operon protein 1 n=1 Tax=Mycolicibacterium novocastrense TaxID=59813 RepID=A0AAW5SFQ7_MYCNV|nr:hypothetical protein [Mycolicibacterium novocastrense]MCV7022593.1 hypothetical protein [Mycolicibacterium novocastrense]GAT08260.1 ComE operon protein 1, precursor [Mycolicibacterium novocastrense]
MSTGRFNRMLIGALLSGGIALAAGLTAGTANATPAPHPQLTFEYSDVAAPGDGSVRATSPQSRLCDGSVRVTGSTLQACDGSVRVALP